MHARVLIAALLSATASLPTPAGADPRPLPHELGVGADHLTVAVDASGAFGAAFREAMASGLHHTIRLEIRLVRRDAPPDAPPVAAYVRDCTVAYDLWGERYTLRVEDEGAPRHLSVPTLDGAVSVCGEAGPLWMVPLAELDLRLLYAVEALLSLDPTAPGPADDAWTGDPLAHRRGGETRTSSLFGAIASVFDRGQEEDATSRVELRGTPFGDARIRTLLEAAAEAATVEQEEE